MLTQLTCTHARACTQGRARPSIAKLYNWRYRSLGDLPAVHTEPRFKAANPGLAYDYQFINVPNFMGKVSAHGLVTGFVRVCVCVCARTCVHVRVHVCVHVRVHVCVLVFLCGHASTSMRAEHPNLPETWTHSSLRS